MTDTFFSALPLSAPMIANLDSLDYRIMTPIQEQSIPGILKGFDLIAKAKTGSGKTAAFAIGLIHKLIVKRYAPQSLVLCPTRELGAQIAIEIRRLVRYQPNVKVLTLCGGQPIRPQIKSLEHGAHILVATPGRLIDHLSRKTVSLKGIKVLVLDEADRMLDMGFNDDIKSIVKQISEKRQTLLFSATYPQEIKKLSQEFQKSPITVSVEALPANREIKQLFYQVKQETKKDDLIRLLRHYHPVSTVIFCNTKQACKELNSHLSKEKFNCLELHGDLEQRERDQVLVRFANQSCSILVATDVAARGLDIDDLEVVINYDLFPQPDVYIHRIGRTGRAGNEGLALSLYSSKEENKLKAIAEFQGINLQRKQIASLSADTGKVLTPPNISLCIYAGKRQKIRPGDIMGALTGEAGVPGENVGKINIFDTHSYVAIKQDSAPKALELLNRKKIKGRFFKVRKVQ